MERNTGRTERLRNVRYEVPFVKNTDDRCLVANIGSVLRYFTPNLVFSDAELNDFCGYIPEMGAWKTQSMLNLAEVGFDVCWIEDENLAGFARNPYEHMKNVFTDPAVYADQIAHSNVALEAERVSKYLEAGLPFEQRPATKDDIISLLSDGFLVRMSVDASYLVNTPASQYDPHSVLIVGYDANGVVLHNAHRNGNIAFQAVEWECLVKVWDDYGASRALNAYRVKEDS